MKERVECDVGSGNGSLETESERWNCDRVARERPENVCFWLQKKHPALFLLNCKHVFVRFVVCPISTDFGDCTDPAQPTNTLTIRMQGRTTPSGLTSASNRVAMSEKDASEHKGTGGAERGKFRY